MGFGAVAIAAVSYSFIYTSKLPSSLQQCHARQLLSAMEVEACLHQPAQMLRDFLNSHNLKTRMNWHYSVWLTGHVTCVPRPSRANSSYDLCTPPLQG